MREIDEIEDTNSKAEAEMNYKNNLYFFLIERGMMWKIKEFEESHDITKQGCPEVKKPDPLTKAQRYFNREKTIKENLRNFIIQLGFAKELETYEGSFDLTINDCTEKEVQALADSVYKKVKRAMKTNSFN